MRDLIVLLVIFFKLAISTLAEIHCDTNCFGQHELNSEFRTLRQRRRSSSSSSNDKSSSKSSKSSKSGKYSKLSSSNYTETSNSSNDSSKSSKKSSDSSADSSKSYSSEDSSKSEKTSSDSSDDSSKSKKKRSDSSDDSSKSIKKRSDSSDDLLKLEQKKWHVSEDKKASKSANLSDASLNSKTKRSTSSDDWSKLEKVNLSFSSIDEVSLEENVSIDVNDELFLSYVYRSKTNIASKDPFLKREENNRSDSVPKFLDFFFSNDSPESKMMDDLDDHVTFEPMHSFMDRIQSRTKVINKSPNTEILSSPTATPNGGDKYSSLLLSPSAISTDIARKKPLLERKENNGPRPEPNFLSVFFSNDSSNSRIVDDFDDDTSFEPISELTNPMESRKEFIDRPSTADLTLLPIVAGTIRARMPTLVPMDSLKTLASTAPKSLPSTKPTQMPSVTPTPLPSGVPTYFPAISPTLSPLTEPSTFPSVKLTLPPTSFHEARSSRITDLIVRVSKESSMSTEPLFIDGTPQSSSLFFLLHTDPMQVNPFMEKKVIQRYALISFYYSTLGGEWIISNFWLSDKDECQWYGVTCNDENSVVELKLDENELKGTLPDTLGLFFDLENLNIDDNRVSGSIPSSIGNLKKIVAIDVDTNFLGGSLPDELYDLSELQILDIDTNTFTGSISSRIKKLKNLFFVQISFNYFSGEIPEEISNLSNLGKL
mmetsp:Transcript_9768/g.21754  ORF Transcript_9768/g.21754 Transcript_9768/m.21754 type:complete len:712 (-) Transcript_9768:419-2554(-)